MVTCFEILSASQSVLSGLGVNEVKKQMKANNKQTRQEKEAQREKSLIKKKKGTQREVTNKKKKGTSKVDWESVVMLRNRPMIDND